MAINKVVYNTDEGEQVLIDLTADTVTPETLAAGATAHNASGEVISGILSPEDGEDGRSILFYDQIPQGNGLSISDFNATPNVGDLAIDGDYNLWEIQSIQGTTATCRKLGNIKGEAGGDGENGERGTGILKVTTSPTSYTTSTAGKNPVKRMSLSTIKSEAGADKVLVGDCISYSYYLYHIYYVDATYAYMDTYQSIRGATGSAGSKGDKGDPGEKGDKGDPGEPGYTPVKGVDYFTESDKAEIVQEVIESTADNSSVPDYVLTEAEEVADKVLSVRNAYTFVMACASDLHTSGSDTSAVGVLHVGQAMNEIQKLTQLDLVAVLGDVQVGDFETTTTGSFKYVKKCFAEVAKSVPYIQLQGNHDELPSDSTEVAQQRYYAYIGANNVGVVTDYANKFRNYGYKDFENYKVRVIYLNTADVSEAEMTYDNNLTASQMIWFANTALNLSVKEDSSEWGVIVLGHHPLNWEASGNKSITKILDVLNAYKGRASGSVTIDGESIAYDFSDETAEFICHIHGHLHNFREEVLGSNKVLSITVPNACFNRNNEYGTYDYATYPEVVKRYGDNGGNNDGTGTQRTYIKTSGTAEDTAFSVFSIDRKSKTINVFNYGSGIDRQWDYVNGVKGEGNGGEQPTVVNQIPLSINADGSEYVGHNGEDGYSVGYRINSGGAEAQQDGMCCTGYISIRDNIACLQNITVTGTKTPYVAYYNQDKSFWQVKSFADVFTDDGSGVFTGSFVGHTGFIRITCGVIDDTSILTIE